MTNLCLGVVNFPDNMGITANVVDMEYRSSTQLYRLLGDFAHYCIEAAKYDTSLCQLAASSLNASDPVTNVIERINKTIVAIAGATYIDPHSRHSFGFREFAGNIRGSMAELDSFTLFAQYLLDAETAVRKWTNRQYVSNQAIDIKRIRHEYNSLRLQ